MEESPDYDKIFDSIPLEVVYHLKKLIKKSGLSDSPRSFNRFMESWLAKRGQFDKIVEEGNYEKEKFFEADNKGSCISLTISGSLVTLGPLIDNTRTATYTSIGVRTDVPMVKIRDKTQLKEDIEIHKPIFFKRGPVRSTSIIIDIGILKPDLNHENQIKLLSTANDLLLNRFLTINRDFLSDKYKNSDLIHRNDLFEKWIILSWFRIIGMEEYIFLARAKFLWLELFLKFYNFLSNKSLPLSKRDEIFLELTNVKFIKYLEIYKWIEPGMKDIDISLLSALESIPNLDSYIEFGDDFYNEYK